MFNYILEALDCEKMALRKKASKCMTALVEVFNLIDIRSYLFLAWAIQGFWNGFSFAKLFP